MDNIIEMAKAHLQNVALRIEELKNQKKSIDQEIDRLTAYLNNGLESIEQKSSGQ